MVGLDCGAGFATSLHPSISMMKATGNELVDWRLWKGRTRSKSMRVVMRNLPRVAYAQRSRYLRRELHRLVVKFLENRGPIDGLDDLSLAADVIIAQCEGLTYLGRVDRSAEELIDVLTEALTRYLLAGTTGSNEPSGRTGA